MTTSIHAEISPPPRGHEKKRVCASVSAANNDQSLTNLIQNEQIGIFVTFSLKDMMMHFSRLVSDKRSYNHFIRCGIISSTRWSRERPVCASVSAANHYQYLTNLIQDAQNGIVVTFS